ncbi:hypothetical protein IV203_011892 [Nitzschia inconspicua]|uniref:Uncharacterized protein n=1 Tax=Nitzschia inconspicua TaxID=303405 RepID=A0A9K3KSX7_9STRA|nr:hypothetical protein IV203_011892 [Nitzschia inconspicua]
MRVGATFTFLEELRESLRKFAHKRGFSITSIGTKFCCSQCAESKCYTAKRLRMKHETATGKKRKRNNTRVGCSFQGSYTFVNYKEKKTDIDLASDTATAHEEAELLSTAEDLDYHQSPAFLTEAFIQFQELLKEALIDQNEVQQILHYLDKRW